MSTKMIQVRNVPDALHRKLKARAAMQGLSLSDYLLGEMRRVAEQPTVQELWDRIKQRGSVELTINSADLIREDRDSR